VVENSITWKPYIRYSHLVTRSGHEEAGTEEDPAGWCGANSATNSATHGWSRAWRKNQPLTGSVNSIRTRSAVTFAEPIEAQNGALSVAMRGRNIWFGRDVVRKGISGLPGRPSSLVGRGLRRERFARSVAPRVVRPFRA
jgi:hypothetical protein